MNVRGLPWQHVGDSSTIVTGQKHRGSSPGLNYKGNGVPQRVAFLWQFSFAKVRAVIGKKCDTVTWNEDM